MGPSVFSTIMVISLSSCCWGGGPLPLLSGCRQNHRLFFQHGQPLVKLLLTLGNTSCGRFSHVLDLRIRSQNGFSPQSSLRPPTTSPAPGGCRLGWFWDHFGIFLDHFGIVLGSFWHNVGIISDWFWYRFEIIWGR